MSRNKSIYQNTIPPIQPDCLLPKFAIPNFSPKFPKDSALNKLSHEFRTDSLLGVNVPLCDLSIYSNCAPEEFDVDDFKFYKELGDKSEKSMLRVPQAQAPRPQQYHQPRILQRRIQEQPQSSLYLKSKSFYSSTDDPAIQEQLQHAFNGNVPEGEVHLIKPQKPLISLINRQSAKPIPKDSFVLVSKGRKYLKVHEFPINDGQPKVAERAFSIIERNYDSNKPEKIYLFVDEQGNYVLGKMRKAFTLSQIAATDMKRERMIATPVVFENFVAEENRHKIPDENERDATPERTRHSNGSSGRSSSSSGSSGSSRSSRSSSSSSRSSRSNSEDEQRKEHDHKDKKNSSESSDSERRVDRHSSSSDRERKGSASSLSSSDNEKKDESKNSSRNSSSSNENRRSSSESHSDNEPKRRDSSQSEREENRHSSHSNSERENNRQSSHSNSEREENRHSSHSNSEREENNRQSSHSNSEREENNRQSSHSNSEKEDNKPSSHSNSEREENKSSSHSEREENRQPSHSNSEREENRQSNSENEQKEGNDDQNSSRNSSSDNDRKSYSSSDGENRNRRSSSSNSSASSSSRSSRQNSASSDSDNN